MSYVLFVNYKNKAVLRNTFDSMDKAFDYVDSLVSGMEQLGKVDNNYSFEIVEILA